MNNFEPSSVTPAVPPSVTPAAPPSVTPAVPSTVTPAVPPSVTPAVPPPVILSASEESYPSCHSHKNPLFVSLVVVAYNEEHCLPLILADIFAQDYPHPAIELLLIDSNAGNNPKQRQLMEEAAALDHDFRRIVILDNPAGYLPHGCNIALTAYEGDVFLRVDAHSRIPADFVRRCVEVLEEGHDVCGGFRPVVLKDPSAWREALLAAETSAFGASPASYRRSQQGSEVPSVFHGAYRRRVLDTVGGYDEDLLRTEDNDMSQRIRAKGFRIWMDPRIYSQQYLRPTLRALLKQKHANGYWIGRTLWIKPKAISLIHLVPCAFVLALFGGVALGITFNWLPLLALCGVYLLADLALSFAAVFTAENPRLTLLALPLIFPAMHVCYGTGTLAGIFSGLARRIFK